MNTKYQIQIKRGTWSNGTTVITKSITLEEIDKYKELIQVINNNANHNTWNWFGDTKILPDTWNGEKFVIDTRELKNHMKKAFDYELTDPNILIDFTMKFLNCGADRIDYIKIFKVEEVEL